MDDPEVQRQAYEAVALPGVEEGYWQLEIRLPDDFTQWETDEDPIQWCEFMATVASATDYKLREAVRWARQAGRSWAEIGGALGITRQSAWQRFASDD